MVLYCLFVVYDVKAIPAFARKLDPSLPTSVETVSKNIVLLRFYDHCLWFLYCIVAAD